MRTLTTIISIVIILAVGSVASYRYVESRTQTMGTLLDSVEESITSDKWEGAQAELNIAQQNWDNDDSWWSIILEHQEIDNININLKRLEKYLGIHDVSQALGEITTLKLLFEHIYNTEIFSLKNIL